MADTVTSMNETQNTKKKALTGAERNQRYRAKRSNNAEFRASENKRVENVRKKRVKKMSPQELEDYRKKTAERVARCPEAKRAKQEEKKLHISIQRLTSPPSSGKGFKSRQAYSKAVNRINDHLPTSPSKKILAFSGVAKKIGINLDEKFRATVSINQSRALPQDTIDIVSSFFERSDIVWTAPGMRDEVTLWEGGVKKKMRKYYLTMFLREAYKLFQASHSDVRIGFSKFCALKPKNVLLLKDTPSDQCKCQKT
ncbi:hypothetical protein EGW08_004862 [Elysia chlorotica]|uniref:Uncharacterized protein n=1 Tax=Elysia chlorotica TaxID=188477 RepID=A0A433U0Y7_ELYCH|nr:hypothetical protein EGW08_004862 [Elysia chlorotica]